ncbi:hypothetical protein [Paraburkholderia aspalathi]|uniref:Uncharacterized protein n=1 Tax=Paraburkholderia aspalathi TaxID=1324617 RepID=A0A1I6Y4W9_9BURK|nr:hypothetical protein [Paraburkholderia aspalathi]SFT45580.1 hypothetical protein SAMN05192563_1001321 [Paraburkholderia aspalathi]
MHPWERRLRDLSGLLKNCGDAYFSPDLFRRNTNQFLQTSRTVTFIIQKNKKEIPDYASWYESNVVAPWSADTAMKWAKDARNVIEKEGDLDLASALHVDLVISHNASEDIEISTTKAELLKADTGKLLRHALAALPAATLDVAVLKIERRWVANSFPAVELIYVMTYVYSRVYEVCRDLAIHLGGELDTSIPHPTALDPTSNDVSRTRYIKMGQSGLGKLETIRMDADPHFKASPELLKIKDEFEKTGNPGNVRETVELIAKLAKATFDQYRNHVPMLFLFDEKWKQIDFISAAFADQADKFIFWRNAADRANYLKAFGFVWVCEFWIRDLKGRGDVPFRQLPIVGERLHVIGGDVRDELSAITWNIRRTTADAKPILEEVEPDDEFAADGAFLFLHPMVTAMKAARRTGA